MSPEAGLSLAASQFCLLGALPFEGHVSEQAAKHDKTAAVDDSAPIFRVSGPNNDSARHQIAVDDAAFSR